MILINSDYKYKDTSIHNIRYDSKTNYVRVIHGNPIKGYLIELQLLEKYEARQLPYINSMFTFKLTYEEILLILAEIKKCKLKEILSKGQ